MTEQIEAFFEKWPARMAKAKAAAPAGAKGFGSLFVSVMKDGELPLRQKELIALAIGVALHCEPCIDLHVRNCLNAGATPRQIVEAAEVAVVMQGGPAYTYLPEVVEALEALGQPVG